jgi:cation transport ATPase
MIYLYKNNNTFLFILISSIFLIFSVDLYCQTSQCLRNQTNCRGICGRFVDKNNDGYCDNTILTEEVKTKITKYKDSIDTINKITNKDNNIINKQQNNILTHKENIETNVSNDLDTTIKNIDKINNINYKTNIQKNTDDNTKSKKLKQSYPLFSLSILIVLLYIISLILVNKKVITKNTQHKIWNCLLLVSFIIVGLTGLLMIVVINYNFIINHFLLLLKLHIISGIIMTLIAIFHFLWHLSYYCHIFNKKSNIKINDEQ